jgi:hypothetical protein
VRHGAVGRLDPERGPEVVETAIGRRDGGRMVGGMDGHDDFVLERLLALAARHDLADATEEGVVGHDDGDAEARCSEHVDGELHHRSRYACAPSASPT